MYKICHSIVGSQATPHPRGAAHKEGFALRSRTPSGSALRSRTPSGSTCSPRFALTHIPPNQKPMRSRTFEFVVWFWAAPRGCGVAWDPTLNGIFYYNISLKMSEIILTAEEYEELNDLYNKQGLDIKIISEKMKKSQYIIYHSLINKYYPHFNGSQIRGYKECQKEIDLEHTARHQIKHMKEQILINNKIESLLKEEPLSDGVTKEQLQSQYEVRRLGGRIQNPAPAAPVNSYKNSCKHWNYNEDVQLFESYILLKKSIEEISIEHSRTIGAIRARLRNETYIKNADYYKNKVLVVRQQLNIRITFE